MEQAQTDTLRAAVIAEPSLNAARQTGDDYAIAAWCNAEASPEFYLVKSSITRDEILTGTSLEGTTFAWAGGAYITRGQGERDAFREMFSATGAVDPNAAPIQAAFADIFSGAGGAGNRTHITAICKRKASNAEKVLKASGVGSLASPAVIGWEGTVSATEASSLR